MFTRRLPRDELKRFVRTTPFSAWEVKRLWNRFSRLDVDGCGSLILEEMLKVDELRCNPFGARIVELFSEDGSGQINFQNFINIFSVFSPNATVDTKMVWAFAMWDFDGDDMIGPRDIKRGVHLLTNADITILKEEEEEEPAADEEQPSTSSAAAKPKKKKKRDSATVRGDKLSEEQMTEIHERVAQEIDPEGAGLSYTDFATVACRMPDFFYNFRMST